VDKFKTVEGSGDISPLLIADALLREPIFLRWTGVLRRRPPPLRTIDCL